jgi:hypothetical protein
MFLASALWGSGIARDSGVSVDIAVKCQTAFASNSLKNSTLLKHLLRPLFDLLLSQIFFARG